MGEPSIAAPPPCNAASSTRHADSGTRPIRSISRRLACGGGASLKEVELSSGFPVGFSLRGSGKGRTALTEALGLRFGCLRLGPLGGPFLARPRTSRVDRSWSFQRVRSQSFFSWRLHLNTSLRASADPTASAQAVRIGPSGTVLFYATILRDQARPNHTDVRLKLLPTDPYPTSD